MLAPDSFVLSCWLLPLLKRPLEVIRTGRRNGLWPFVAVCTGGDPAITACYYTLYPLLLPAVSGHAFVFKVRGLWLLLLPPLLLLVAVAVDLQGSGVLFGDLGTRAWVSWKVQVLLIRCL